MQMSRPTNQGVGGTALKGGFQAKGEVGVRRDGIRSLIMGLKLTQMVMRP